MKLVLFAAALTIGSAALAQTTTTATTGNDGPERDARGIPVVSDQATPPAGANQPVAAQPGATYVPNPNAQATFATQPSTKTYPPCSRTVTDGCVQTYERGVRSPG